MEKTLQLERACLSIGAVVTQLQLIVARRKKRFRVARPRMLHATSQFVSVGNTYDVANFLYEAPDTHNKTWILAIFGL